MIVYSDDQLVAISFSVISAVDLETALGEVDNLIAQQFENISLGEVENIDVKGMNAVWIDGTADGLEMAFEVIDAPYEDINLLVSAWGTTEAINNYLDDIKMIFGNITPSED